VHSCSIAIGRAPPEIREAALALAQEADDTASGARLLGALGMLWGGHKDYQRGLELTRQAVIAAEAATDRRALAEARVRVGVMLLNLARMAESRRAGGRAWRLVACSGGPAALSKPRPSSRRRSAFWRP
jgi:hypothetical protein